MAGITTAAAATTNTFTFKPSLPPRTVFQPIPFRVTLLSNRAGPVSARISSGGGGFRPGPGGSRRSRDARTAEYEYDAAVDISSISSSSVRLIDAQQTMVGVVSKSEAIQMAEEAELDLVILSPDADPPVVRIMDYNKYRYEQQKRKKDQLKKSAGGHQFTQNDTLLVGRNKAFLFDNSYSIASVPFTYEQHDYEILLLSVNRFKIDSHDYAVRLRAAQKFLNDGHKVKIIVNLKGRENEFRNIAIALIKRFQNEIGELATEESKDFNQRNIYMVLVPNKTILQKVQEQKKKEKTMTEVSANV
ncbi:hypothetical protein QJS04_geneDACA013653 [Acorus gramineus]|uniref:Translation initiation factor IF-3 n=1 Tax=Acorus gramineus TaxID=55184 RepID=A0AAV9AYQ3_ACOGR|nr:hypothetical protein QJS04_geneDACA013653 [Acorus gramineus]